LIVADGDGVVTVVPLRLAAATAISYAIVRERERRALAILDAGGVLLDRKGILVS